MIEIVTIVDEMEKGYGWTSIQYMMSNQRNSPFKHLNRKQFCVLVYMLIERRMLVDESKIGNDDEYTKKVGGHALVTFENFLESIYG